MTAPEPPPRLPAEGLVRALQTESGRRELAERVSPVGGPGLLLVDLAGGDPLAHGVPDALAEALRGVPAVVVAVGAAPGSRLGDLCDVRVAPAEVDALWAAHARRPLAGLAFAQLLRGSLQRSVAEGLVVESLVYSTLQAGPEFARWCAGRETTPAPPDPAGGPVRIRRRGPVLELVLCRPHRHNAVSVALRDALMEGLDLALADDAIERVELSGEGPSFCSGGELAEFGSRPDPATAHAVRSTRSPAAACHQLAGRLHARVHGACLGAGVELPAFAERVTATPDACFGLPELDLGLVPGAGGSVSLPRRIGRQRTAWLGLTGRRIDAERARAWGLVDAIAAPGDPVD